MENKEVKEYYQLLLDACRCEDAQLAGAYRQLRELLEHACRTQLPDSSLQMTDLSARVNFVASKVGLSVVEQNRLHTFRLTSNDILNHRTPPVREQLLRDAKTLAFFIKRLTGENIPDELYRLLPQADATYIIAPPASKHFRRLRVSFLHADEKFLYVMPVDTVADEPLRVRYNVPQVNDEFADTCRLLWQHAQLNLVDVAADEAGILTPSFIILEPDYLIDISSLAECFKEYGHHPGNYLLSRLMPSENARPLLLGNIANQFLDEWIHADGTPDYRACMKKAFQTYPIELAACQDLLDKKTERAFFDDCLLHFENIRKTVQEVFPSPGYELDRADAVLEPTYICEALGLQGRLDYMQRDMTSFIEMKSGKADEYSIRGKVEPKENNKVQMLLYQAVLEYSMGMDHHHVKAYLLYTRYPLLYPARPSWAMVRRVMDVRNRIVAGEYAMQLHNNPAYTARCLEVLNPAVLNERQLNNILWNRYIGPAVSRPWNQLQGLTPLEQTYFYTLYNFITKELYTSKSGDVEHEGCTGAASLWRATLDEKRESGEILYDLCLEENKADDVAHPYVVLHMPVADDCPASDTDERNAPPNFRQGDSVVLYERNADTDDVTNHIIFKGNIEWITDTGLCIRLRMAQRNTAVLPAGSRYAVEHDSMDTAFRGMYSGLAAFLQATQERRDLLLGVRPSQTDVAFRPRIAAATDDFERITLKAQAARDYFLLVGPPGTGKTSRALRGMVEAFLREGKQILLLSYTNRAVDEICKALSNITPAVSFMRIGSELSCEEAYRPHLAEEMLKDCPNRRAVQERIAGCSIFVGTVATLTLRTDLFKLKSFDVAIVDEATQILEPQLLRLLCLRGSDGKDAIGKFILIGDHKQLPAVVLQSAEQSEVYDERLRAIGLRNLKNSLFERLYSSLTGGSEEHVAADSPFYDMLCRQGRMNNEVAAFPNQAFYGGLLRPIGLEHQTGDLTLAPQLVGSPLASLLTARVAFIPSEAEPPLQSVKMNHDEARIVARLAADVYRQYAALEDFGELHTLGVITPYRSQIALIRRELAALSIEPLNHITVDTVERYQGSERDVIIYSFCLNRAWQLKFLANLTEENGVQIDRKLNVALTRARKQMFITGVPKLMELNPIYARLLKEIHQFSLKKA